MRSRRGSRGGGRRGGASDVGCPASGAALGGLRVAAAFLALGAGFAFAADLVGRAAGFVALAEGFLGLAAGFAFAAGIFAVVAGFFAFAAAFVAVAAGFLDFAAGFFALVAPFFGLGAEPFALPAGLEDPFFVADLFRFADESFTFCALFDAFLFSFPFADPLAMTLPGAIGAGLRDGRATAPGPELYGRSKRKAESSCRVAPSTLTENRLPDQIAAPPYSPFLFTA